MRKIGIRRYVFGLLLIAAAGAEAREADSARWLGVRVDGDSVTAIDKDGTAMWARHLDLLQPLQVEQLRNGLFKVNGVVVLDAQGRIVAADATDPAEPEALAAAQTYMWDASSPINGDISASFVRPVFDKKGNAWAVIDDADAQVARVVEYVAKKGIWKEVQKLPQIFSYGHLDVDQLGNVTIVALSASQADGYALNAVRYEPSTGWTKPAIIFSEPYSANAIINFGIVGDKYGNAIVVAGETTYGAISVVYSAASSAWLPMQPLVMPADFSNSMVNGISISRSPNGKYVDVAYSAVLQAAGESDYYLAYYSHAFDISSLTFGPPELLPKTDVLKGEGTPANDNGGDNVKMVVDNVGTEYVIWSTSPQLRTKKLIGTYASVKKKGVWKDPVMLSKTVYSLGSAFSDIAVDADGRVGACTTAFLATSPASTQYVVFRFLPDSGWKTDVVATWQGSLQTRSRIAWFGSGQAVGTYLIATDVVGGYQALSSSVFDAGAWGSSFPIPPDKTTAFSQSLATSPSGVPLLLFNPASADFVNTIVQFTFLRAGN